MQRFIFLKAANLATRMSVSQNLTTKNSPLLGSATKSLNSVNYTKQCSTNGNIIPVVTYEEIKKLTNHSPQLLIDVREPKELQETGKIPTSINIPLGQVAQELAASVDKVAFKTKYGREKPENDTEIIFHCRSGRRSQNAAELARALGYKNTKNYLGSWLEYAEREGFSK